MSAERLRAAATRLQEMAGAAGDGPWAAESSTTSAVSVTTVYRPAHDDAIFEDEHADEADAAYIAMMHPPVALALAEMLEGDAEDVDGIEDRFFEDGWMKTVLAVADAVLGGEGR